MKLLKTSFSRKEKGELKVQIHPAVKTQIGSIYFVTLLQPILKLKSKDLVAVNGGKLLNSLLPAGDLERMKIEGYSFEWSDDEENQNAEDNNGLLAEFHKQKEMGGEKKRPNVDLRSQPNFHE